MDVQYRQAFLKDLKKLRGQSVYDRVYKLAFVTLPEVDRLRDVPGVKAMKGYPHRYHIRIGNYRIGIEAQGSSVEVMRVLHRRESYRYFP